MTEHETGQGKAPGKILFPLVLVAVFLLDQATKAWIIGMLPVHGGFPVIDGFFNIVHVRNPGAAFGFLAGAPPQVRYVFFLAVSAAAIILILQYVRSLRPGQEGVLLSLALILAGAVGNLVDRLRFGEVVDFLDFYVGPYHWPAFNVADSAITTGAVFLAMFLMRKRRSKGQA